MPEFAVKLNSKALVVGLGENTVLAGRERTLAENAKSLAEIAANTALAAGNFIDGGKAAAESATSEGDFFSYSDGDGGIVYAVRDAVGSTEIAQAATKALVDTKVATADLASPDDGKGAEIPAYKAPGIGSIVRTVKDKLLEIISVKDKGAIGDGSNASPAFASAGSGAVIPPGTYALDDNVVGDFYALPGAQVTGGLRSRVYRIGSGPEIDTNAYKKSVVGEIPLNFPDYETARAGVGSPSFIYPQGFTYDNSGNLFIKYGSGTSAVIVIYNADLTYVGWFKITAGGESLVIVQNGSSRLLYSSASGNLREYDITTLPANGATVSSTVRISESVGLQFTQEGGQWIVEQDFADIGVEASRTKFNVYDAAFNRTGEITIPKTLVGYQTSSSDYYPYIPKMQGIRLVDGNIYIAHGGSYIPATSGPVASPVSDYGVTELTMDGRIIRRGVVNANGLLDRMVADGFDATRTENEGVARHPDGSIHSMLITKRPGDATASSVGIVLFREFDPGGKDYSGIRSRFAPFNSNRLTDVFPRSPGGILDPLTLQPFTTLNALIKFMADFQLPRTSFYSSAVTLTPLSGMPSIPSSAIVEIRNANNSTFLIMIESVTGPPKRYRANRSGSIWSATSIWEPA